MSKHPLPASRLGDLAWCTHALTKDAHSFVHETNEIKVLFEKHRPDQEVA